LAARQLQPFSANGVLSFILEARLPLSALLSWVVVAFTIEFDDEFEIKYCIA
jgi:hypothetical protein